MIVLNYDPEEGKVLEVGNEQSENKTPNISVSEEEFNEKIIKDNKIAYVINGILEGKVNIDHLRGLREMECFSIINRGELWYSYLNNERKEELQTWYQDWLNVTETKIIPQKPSWLE